MSRTSDGAPKSAESGAGGAALPAAAGAPDLVRARSVEAAGGRTIVITGELQASEDLTIDGQVEGKVDLLQHRLTVGPEATLRAEVFARSVIVLGTVKGDVTAIEKVDLRPSAFLQGNIVAPRVEIAEGARFNGRIDMPKPKPVADTAAARKSEGAPAGIPGVAVSPQDRP